MFKDLTIEMTCPFCGAIHSVAVSSAEYDAWLNGELAQNALVSLTATEREQLISHLCPACQDDIFSPDLAGEDCDGDCENCPLYDDCGIDEDEDEDYDYDDADLEMGFNPYEGCYDWDC